VALDNTTVVGVVGAGAMGTGIAQVAAAAGHRVILGDARQGATAGAQAAIAKAMDREVEKGRMSRNAADELMARIDFQWEALGDDLAAYKRCGMIIEAVIEDLETKRALFRRLESVVAANCVLATNTSSPMVHPVR